MRLSLPCTPAALVALVFAAGCGSVARDTSPEAPNDDAALTDSHASADLDAGIPTDATVVPGFVCPTATPENTQPCTNGREQCEYGASTLIDCNTLALCEETEDGERAWYVTTNDAGCAFDTAACGDSAALLQGASCTLPATGPNSTYIECDFPGQTCSCSIDNPWSCQPTSAPCPAVRPHLGAPCAQATPAGFLCAYADLDIACADGNWVTVPIK